MDFTVKLQKAESASCWHCTVVISLISKEYVSSDFKASNIRRFRKLKLDLKCYSR